MTAEPDFFDPPLHVGQLNLPSIEQFRQAFEGIFDRRFFANHGPLEQQLDAALASFFGVRNAISVLNGTVALMLALRALGLKGEVISTSFTFPATIQALVWAGLKPVFCDVDSESHMLTALLVEAKIRPATVAILGLHAWGRACVPLELGALARRHGLKLVFDAAHAMGCTFKGQRIGGFGDAEVFSFHATKILNSTEGGCITTNDDELATRIRTMRSFHDTSAGTTGLLRLNAKISEAQAAMALLGLGNLDALIDANRSRFELYRRELRDIPGLHFVDHAAGEKSNYQFVVVSISAPEFGMTRDELLEVLRTRRVLARNYFYPGVHRTPPFSQELVDLPVTQHLCEVLLHLPNGQVVTESDVSRICAIIRTAAAKLRIG